MENVEKKLTKDLADLFSKMREQRDTMSLQGIEDMYNSKPIEGVLYEPCVRIPCTDLYVKAQYPSTLYYCSNYKLPKNEYIVFIKTYKDNGSQNSPGSCYCCIAITNYGRFIRTYPVRENRQFGGYNSYSPVSNNEICDTSHGQCPSGITPIIKLDPLSYKLPNWFLQSFITHEVLYADPNTPTSVFYVGTKQNPNTLTSSLDTTTNVLQELNKEFYLFVGKWKPHMTEHVTLNIDTMRQTIIDNAHYIEELKGKEERLEQQNKSLHVELNQIKEQKASLEKEKAVLLPLEKYKEAVIEFMNEKTHTAYGTDSTIIDSFKKFHSNNVFVDKYDYNDVMKSKEELNEYRIYKKVKGEMVSSGMDNSSVAKNVRSIKKTINKPKIQVPV